MTRRTCLEQAEPIAAAEARLAAGETQRGVTAVAGIARSTLRERWGGVPRGDPPTGLTAFARTPDGSVWLHRMVLAAQFSITLRAAGGHTPCCSSSLPACALAAATATPTATPAETNLSDADRGMTAVDGIMNKAGSVDSALSAVRPTGRMKRAIGAIMDADTSEVFECGASCTT